ncbi:hypothetical protein, partial [Pseudomonas viridiflava]|uniref:hypothetical protein n=1 Tax=Pseudomonas viridiflava TaxID=33069 RepID=UPI001981DFF8
VDVSQPVPGDGSQGGYGWRVQARQGDDGTGGLVEAGWLNRVGRYSLGAARQGDANFAYANASGSVVCARYWPEVSSQPGKPILK